MSLDLDRSTWTRVKFSDIADSISDRVDDPSKAGVDRYVGLEHLDSGSMTVSRWGSPDDVDATKLRFLPGDVIFGRRRAYQKKVSRADFEGICSAHAMVLRARPELVDPDFLPVFLSSDYFLDRAIQISVGSLSPTVNWKTLKAQEFDLPPLDQQRRIADLLWAVESEVQAARTAYQGTLLLTQVYVDLNFGVSSSAVELSKLVGPGGIKIGPFGAQLHASDYVESGVPVVMPQDMSGNAVSEERIKQVPRAKAQELSAHALLAGDILLPRRGELDRRALITETQAGWLCGTGSVRVRPKAGVKPAVILLALSATSTLQWLYRNASGTTMPNLNASIVAKIPITLPSDKDLPEVMANVSELDMTAELLKQRIIGAGSLRTELTAEIFRESN